MLSDCYPPRLGGIETQVHDLAHALVAAGHEVEVFTATTGSQGQRFGTQVDEGGVVVHRFAIPLPGGIPVNPFAPTEIGRRLTAGRFDVAHGHMGIVSPFATSLIPLALRIGLPTAVTWHCVIDRSAPWLRLVGRARRWAERGAALSAVSRMAADRVEAVCGAPVSVLGNGIDATWWRRPGKAAPGQGTPEQAVRVVSAIRLARRKRPLATLEVLARARELLDPEVAFTATVFGDGPQRPHLERRVGQSMPWVRLAGRVSREELRTAYWESDIYLSTARLESFGIAALEARAAGLIVLARGGTGVEDFIADGRDGFFGDSDEALAARLARLVSDGAARTGIQAHLAATAVPNAWPDMVLATVAEYSRAGAG